MYIHIKRHIGKHVTGKTMVFIPMANDIISGYIWVVYPNLVNQATFRFLHTKKQKNMGNSTLESKHYIILYLYLHTSGFSSGTTRLHPKPTILPRPWTWAAPKRTFFPSPRCETSGVAARQNSESSSGTSGRSSFPRSEKLAGMFGRDFHGINKNCFFWGKNIGPSHGHLWENRLSNASNLIPSRKPPN